MVREPIRHAGFDVGLLAVRLSAGVALTWHGIGKFGSEAGWTNWMGPEAAFPAWAQGVAAVTETLGGLGLAVGFLTPLASLGVLAVMGGALHFHITRGDPYVSSTGSSWEYPALLLAVALLALLAGAGRLSLDGWLRRRRRARYEKPAGTVPEVVATTRRVRSGDVVRAAPGDGGAGGSGGKSHEDAPAEPPAQA